LLLTGGPKVGKSSLAHAIARRRKRAAVIDVDDVRQLLVRPHVAVWDGEEGRRQHVLGVRNACALVANFVDDGCDVVVADVVDDELGVLYRHLLSHTPLSVIRLLLPIEDAWRRCEARPHRIPRSAFVALYERQDAFSGWDLTWNVIGRTTEHLAADACALLDELGDDL